MNLLTSVAAKRLFLQHVYKMEMKSFVGKGILFSFVVALVISGAHTQEVTPNVCSGIFDRIGSIVCDPNAHCFEADAALSCICNDGYKGDGWKLGSACYTASVGERVKRDPGWDAKAGMWNAGWITKEAPRPCYAQWITLGTLLCDSSSQCMVTPDEPVQLKCKCPVGRSGDGYASSWGGSGCN